ncbi:DMT family transporter [Flammeovirga yaeyamensis]|uniref:DMT family transporter n=1 Tax=Flammeovirga yaeyamensis TaxID=367791 RepID=A0AAX1N110_9BACT|nr:MULTISPECIES: DMT family transporter [Flammeovirga]ANQ47419.1 DMT family transporter [Flammeovirga sp. MY04]MBB3698465.1 drug/metabolite transporter (DMT)-like permease [Flammeovirga yaeyamensis]NMF34186.1 DMT family transporter [Flammeovirga yaeyamensis]QWG01171.1 DMT family transporter [Flammeovirga yaeyamensis]
MKLHLGKGSQQMLLSAFVITSMQVIVKVINHIPPQEIVFFRALIAFVISYVTLKRQNVNVWGNNKGWLLTRGFVGTLGMVLLFASYQNLPLATAVVLQNLAPLFTAVLAVLFLNKTLKPIQYLFFILSIVGVVVIKGFDPDVDMFYLVVSVLGALAAAGAYTAIGKLKGKEHPVVIIFYFPFIAVPLTGVWCYFTEWTTPAGWDWVALLAIGILSQISQILLTKAYQSDDDTATVASMNYSSVIYGVAYGILLFGEFFSWQVLMGMLLVVAGSILNLIYTNRKAVTETKA